MEKELKISQHFLDKSWLMEIYPELKNLSDGLVAKDEKERKEIKEYPNQVANILFDFHCKNYLNDLKGYSTDIMIISCKQGKDERGSYQIKNKLHVMSGKIFSFCEESANISNNNDYHWFIQKLHFPDEDSLLEHKNQFNFSKIKWFENVKKYVQQNTFDGIYPTYLSKVTADYFFK